MGKKTDQITTTGRLAFTKGGRDQSLSRNYAIEKLYELYSRSEMSKNSLSTVFKKYLAVFFRFFEVKGMISLKVVN